MVAMFLKLWPKEPTGLWKVSEKGKPAIIHFPHVSPAHIHFPDTCTAFLANVTSCHPSTPPRQHTHRYCGEKYQKGLACISLTIKLLWQLSRFPQTPGEKRKWAENNSVIKHASELARYQGWKKKGDLYKTRRILVLFSYSKMQSWWTHKLYNEHKCFLPSSLPPLSFIAICPQVRDDPSTQMHACS